MTYPLESKWTSLRKNAIAHYESVIFPSTPADFDATNPKPRIALNIELARISEKERKEGGKSQW